jgi:hypothetical protein
MGLWLGEIIVACVSQVASSYEPAAQISDDDGAVGHSDESPPPLLKRRVSQPPSSVRCEKPPAKPPPLKLDDISFSEINAASGPAVGYICFDTQFDKMINAQFCGMCDCLLTFLLMLVQPG